jgi:protein-tyrosine phosphatase
MAKGSPGPPLTARLALSAKLACAILGILMVDIHCHIFAELDDGAESLEISRAMAEMAIADGITHVAGTPHASSSWHFDPEVVQRRRDELQAEFAGRLTLGVGCDFHLSYDNLQDIRTDSWRYTLNEKNYLLVEFADFAIPAPLDQSLHELQLAGIQPIITHPERNPLIRAQPDRLTRWLRQGCYAQITASSFLGKWGPSAQDAAERWLEAGMVHFIASDAHNITSRPLRLKETYDLVAQRWSPDTAEALLVENPRAAFEGRPLPWVPELPDEKIEGQPAPKRKKFWLF